MGTVYEARHLRIGRRVAIKFLDADLARDEGNLARFRNEARVCSAVGHPNLVDIIDEGSTPEGIPFMVMELLDGLGLGEWLSRTRGRIPSISAVTLVLEVLRTLEAVHAVGIVHRDLKPENIFLHGDADEPRIKLLDFGVSLLQVVDDHGRRLTRAGDVFGTPQHMSPEQAQGRLEVDARSDLFSVGTILYEMVTGRPAFEGDNPLATIQAVAWGEYDRPASLVPGIDRRLTAVIERALQRHPADRYPSAAAFAADLETLAREDPRWRPGRIVALTESLPDAAASAASGPSDGAGESADRPEAGRAGGTWRWPGGPPGRS
jgi:serine/threonine-protein kinase